MNRIPRPAGLGPLLSKALKYDNKESRQTVHCSASSLDDSLSCCITLWSPSFSRAFGGQELIMTQSIDPISSFLLLKFSIRQSGVIKSGSNYEIETFLISGLFSYTLVDDINKYQMESRQCISPHLPPLVIEFRSKAKPRVIV